MLKLRSQVIALAVSFGLLFSMLTIKWTDAQGEDGGWIGPERLSSETGQASQGYMVSDQYGYVHVFWSETGLPDGRPVIVYSRFDGETWSPPIDIFVSIPDTAILFISPDVDSNGNLHLLWSEGTYGPIFYSHAPAHSADKATAWRSRIIVEIPAFWGRLKVDSKGVIHVFYSDFYGDLPGVYYLRSADMGITWSSPLWLDPDIPPEYAPSIVSFEVDDSDGLHAFWYYVDRGAAGGNIRWIRYSHSFDGGETWSQPFTIDQADESTDELRAAYPVFTVQGKNIHAIWAGDNKVHREHRYSRDSGETWSSTNRIMGDLVGMSLGDGLAADSEGRIHHIPAVRYPVGLYHALWNGSSWSIPSLFYLISENPEDEPGDRIVAHNIRLTIRAGNQLVTTFTSSPNDPQFILYAMNKTLSDLSPVPLLPTPTTVPTASPTLSTVESEGAPTQSALGNELANLPRLEGNPVRQTTSILWGLVPSLLLLAGVIVYRSLRKR